VLIRRRTIFRKLLRQVSSSSCPTKELSLVVFLVEDACVGAFINLCPSGYDFVLSLLSSLCLAFASPSRIAAAIGCPTLVMGRDIICFG
jgi:hypothetical protein